MAERWIKLNVKVFKETGKLMEKYDVKDVTKLAGGGEYPGQIDLVDEWCSVEAD